LESDGPEIKSKDADVEDCDYMEIYVRHYF